MVIKYVVFDGIKCHIINSYDYIEKAYEYCMRYWVSIQGDEGLKIIQDIDSSYTWQQLYQNVATRITEKDDFIDYFDGFYSVQGCEHHEDLPSPDTADELNKFKKK